MNDTDKDLIRKAAEFVGWHPYPVYELSFRDGTNCNMMPCVHRTDLHALVGLVEDKVRESVSAPDVDYAINTAWHEDHALCRLEALMNLDEQTNGAIRSEYTQT